MSIACKTHIAGILAAIAWLGVTGAAWAETQENSKVHLVIGAKGAHPHVEGTADVVHVVKVDRSIVASQIVITLRIDDGFHINANPASHPYLIPTSVSFVGVRPSSVTYPTPVRFKPKFADEPLEVYDGTVLITALFSNGALDGAPDVRATVTAQACTDQICLPPADLPVSE